MTLRWCFWKRTKALVHAPAASAPQIQRLRSLQAHLCTVCLTRSRSRGSCSSGHLQHQRLQQEAGQRHPHRGR